MDELTFVDMLTADQPFMPKYFGYDVELNKKGALPIEKSTSSVPRLGKNAPLEKGVLIVDTRPQAEFSKRHLPCAVNIQQGEKFETWLGSIVGPEEPFYLIAEDEASMDNLIRKAAKIGYESNIKGALLNPDPAIEATPQLNEADYRLHPDRYTIVDVRNWGEINEGKIFNHSISLPLPELRERLNEIPVDRPIVVHCAAGYRSAAATSIIACNIKAVPVYDLGETIKEIRNQKSEV